MKKNIILTLICVSAIIFLAFFRQNTSTKQSDANIAQKIAADYNNRGSIGRHFSENEIMKINIPSLTDNGSLLSKYTCDGQNISPEIRMSNVPKETESLLILVTDPDTPPAYKFNHWLLFNINPNTVTIKEDDIPSGAVNGTNDYGDKRYKGPCPPKGDQHRYFFYLYAITTKFSTDKNLSKTELEERINPYLLQRAEAMGWYKR